VIVDAIIYNGERDLLRCRLQELDGIVDDVLIVQALHTHQGEPLERVDHPELDGAIPLDTQLRISYQTVSLPDPGGDRGGYGSPAMMRREGAHRDAILPALEQLGLADDDVVWLSDADEIPRRVVVEELNPERTGIACTTMRVHPFAVDWLFPSPIAGPCCFTMGFLRKVGSVQFCRVHRADEAAGSRVLDGLGGWHLTWLGGPEAWRRKRDSFSHAELREKLTDDELMRCWRDGFDVNGMKLLGCSPVSVELPRWVRDRLDEGNVPEWWLRHG